MGYQIETQSEPSQIPTNEFFTKIVNSYKALTIFTKNSVIDTSQGYHCTSIKSLQKEFWKCSRQDTFLFAQSSWANPGKALAGKSTENYLVFPAHIYQLKANTWKMYEIYSKLAIIFTVNKSLLEQILHLYKISNYWLWTGTCLLGCGFWHSYLPWIFQEIFRIDPTGSYLHKLNNRNTRTTCKTCSKLTIMAPSRTTASVLIREIGVMENPHTGISSWQLHVQS